MRFFILSLLLVTSLQAAPQWIWLSKDGNKDNAVTFRHRFEVPQNAQLATLELTCDNGAVASLNGKKVLTNADWQEPVKADVTKDIKLGESNEIIVKATNKGGTAALVARLTLKLPDGRANIVIETSGKWEATTTGKEEWKPALVINEYGKGPWGLALDGKAGGGKNS
ncbi:MAG TPA: heme-binding protein, partial [Verrucomicrobiales bacterium]|nr:heme-binding protein [Verrucomicrobiales bacterium]